MNPKNSHQYQLLRINFQNASLAALTRILDALNAEVDQAIDQDRLPILEKAFGRLDPSTCAMN